MSFGPNTRRRTMNANQKWRCVSPRSMATATAYPPCWGTYSASGPTYRTDILEGTDWDGKMETIADYEEFLSMPKRLLPDGTL